jgi:putative transcriptional regulator
MADGSERAIAAPVVPSMMPQESQAAYARRVRAATRLTQADFAARLGVPVETVRNWEQGKRAPRGPARALLKLIERAPELAFAALAH